MKNERFESSKVSQLNGVQGNNFYQMDQFTAPLAAVSLTMRDFFFRDCRFRQIDQQPLNYFFSLIADVFRRRRLIELDVRVVDTSVRVQSTISKKNEFDQ